MPLQRYLPVLIWRMPIPAHCKISISTTVCPDLPFDLHVELMVDSEDQTNLHRLARHNAQEAISLAKQRAQDFDAQAALERKTNEALRLAKGQAHLRDNEEEQTEGTPLVDRTYCPLHAPIDIVDANFSGFGRTKLPEPDFPQRSSDS